MKNLNNKNNIEQSYDKNLIDMINDIKQEQDKIQQVIINNHKVLMKRINKIQEFNEISDMRSTVLYNELKKIKEKI